MRKRRYRSGASNLLNVDTQQPLVDGHPNTVGLVGLWKALPAIAGGVTWYDLSGQGNHGTLTNGPTWSSGRDGTGAVRFDMVNDYVDLGNPLTLKFGTGDFSISVWFHASSVSTYQALIGKDVDGQRDWTFWVGASANKIGFSGFTPVKNIISANTITANQWYHGVVTRQSGTATLYIDCEQNGSLAITQDFSGTNNLNIGRREYPGFEQYFNGLIDDVSIYNRALSASEISAQYEDRVTGKYDMFRYVNRNAFWSVAGSGFTGSPWYHNLQQSIISGAA